MKKKYEALKIGKFGKFSEKSWLCTLQDPGWAAVLTIFLKKRLKWPKTTPFQGKI